MPALQVRDFPDELYEQLKAYAASQHRSVAQQTIVAVEQMLEAADAQHYGDAGSCTAPCARSPISTPRKSEPPASRSARSCSRGLRNCRSSSCLKVFPARQN